MTEAQKTYVKSLEKWLENQKLNIDQIKFNNEFNRKEVEFHKKHLKLGEEQLKHEIQRAIDIEQTINQIKRKS